MSNRDNPPQKKPRPKQTAQPNVGGKYETSVATLVAAILSNNKQIENYQVWTNLLEAHPFDDVVAKVFFKGEDTPYAYAIQVKHIRTGETFKVKKVTKYLKGYSRIFNNGGFKTIGDIPVDNIHFCYFCVKDVRTVPDYTLREHKPANEWWESILHFENCHTLFYNKSITDADKKRKDFLDKFYLYFYQPNINLIKEKIETICKISSATDILQYVDVFLEKVVLWQSGLSKEIFQTELLKIRLADYILPPTATIQLNDSQIVLWNKLVLEYDVTIVKRETNIEKSLFGCLAQALNYFLNNLIGWEKYKTSTLDSTVKSAFRNFFIVNKSGIIRHWVDPPTTLKSLIIEFWKCGKVPLILRSDDDLPVLKDYAHLNKKYIIITDNVVNKRRECKTYQLEAFTRISDIESLEVRNELLQTIRVSLLGSQPVTLYSIVNHHTELIMTLSCSHILHLMKTRKSYLSKEYVDGDYDHNIAFLIEDPTSTEECNIGVVNRKTGNIAIWCKPEDITRYRSQIEENSKFRCVYRCITSSESENLTLVEGNEMLLRDFFVDQDGEDVYCLEDNIVPILGRRFPSIHQNYISRFLRCAVVSKSLFNSQTRGICFFFGDLKHLDENIRVNTIKVPWDKIDEITQLSNENVFINIEGEDVDKYWRKALTFKRPLLYIRVEETGMQLCRYNEWKGLSDHISFSGREISEESFLMEISDGITIVTGEPGIGKSSLLRSLFRNSGEEKYILFYNLTDYKLERKKSLATLSSLDFILNEFKNTRYGEFLSDLFKRQENLLVILDSFDEVLACRKEEILNFIRNLVTSNIQIIIASRLRAKCAVMDNFETNIFKVDTLRVGDREKYIKNCNIREDVLTAAPLEFLENPLYLNFLKVISENSGHVAQISKLDLFGNIIRIRLDQYYEKCSFTIEDVSDKEDLLEHVLELHRKLALVRILGVDIVEELLKWKYEKGYANHLKLGIIISIDKDSYPTFEHETFAEYLTADWILRNKTNDCGKNIYLEMLKQEKLYILDIICEHLDLHKAILEKNESQLGKCVKDCSHLEKTDDLGRMSIHIAAAHHKDACWDWSPIDQIIRNMDEYKINFTHSDLLMDWDWVQHLNQGNDINLMLCNRFSMPAKAAYLNCVVQKLQMGVKLHIDLEAYAITPIYMKAMEEGGIDMIRDLLFIEDALSNGTSVASKHRECQALEANMFKLRKIRQMTPLHVACIYGNMEVVKELIKLKHEVNATDSFGCIPLHYSVINPSDVRMEMTKILLENGSKIDTKNRSGKTAFGVAIHSENLDIMELFLQKGPSIFNSNRKDFWKLLYLAIDREDDNMVNLLYKCKEEAKITSRALTDTSSTSNSESGRLFLEDGANNGSKGG